MIQLRCLMPVKPFGCYGLVLRVKENIEIQRGSCTTALRDTDRQALGLRCVQAMWSRPETDTQNQKYMHMTMEKTLFSSTFSQVNAYLQSTDFFAG